MDPLDEQALIGLPGDHRRPALAAALGEPLQPQVELALERLASAMAVQAIRLEDRPDVPRTSASRPPLPKRSIRTTPTPTLQNT